MYPYLRLLNEIRKARKLPKLGFLEPHISELICWPTDIDIWLELNNGRTLTLYDLGRVPLALRCGLLPVLRQNGWKLAVAGASVRYRQRVTTFQKLKMITQLAGWDERFLYMDQSMWRGENCTSQVLIRTAITTGKGLISPQKLMDAANFSGPAPELPAWIRAWSNAEGERPWPPENRSLLHP